MKPFPPDIQQQIAEANRLQASIDRKKQGLDYVPMSNSKKSIVTALIIAGVGMIFYALSI